MDTNTSARTHEFTICRTKEELLDALNNFADRHLEHNIPMPAAYATGNYTYVLQRQPQVRRYGERNDISKITYRGDRHFYLSNEKGVTEESCIITGIEFRMSATVGDKTSVTATYSAIFEPEFKEMLTVIEDLIIKETEPAPYTEEGQRLLEEKQSQPEPDANRLMPASGSKEIMELRQIRRGSPADIATAITQYRIGNSGIFGGSTPFALLPATPRQYARNLGEILLDTYSPAPINTDANPIQFEMKYSYQAEVPARRVYGGDSEQPLYISAQKTGYIIIFKLPDNKSQLIIRTADDDWTDLKPIWEALADYLIKLGFYEITGTGPEKSSADIIQPEHTLRAEHIEDPSLDPKSDEFILEHLGTDALDKIKKIRRILQRGKGKYREMCGIVGMDESTFRRQRKRYKAYL